MRKGEALGLHWTDVDLDARLLFVRHTLVAVDNSHLVFNPPKTTGSRDWIALSARAVAALRRQARRHRAMALTGPAYHDEGLVFCRPDGQPLRPEYVLRHFYELTEAAAVPRIHVHDLRHLAATIMIAAGVPLAMVSKTLRHSTPVDHRRHLRPPHPPGRSGCRRRYRYRTQQRRPQGEEGNVGTAFACDHIATTIGPNRQLLMSYSAYKQFRHCRDGRI
jgi:integrase